MKRVLLIPLLVLLAAGAPCRAEEVLVEHAGYYLDLPEGWSLLDARDLDSISFTDRSRSAVFQVMTFPAGRFAAIADLSRHVLDRLKTKGELGKFPYEGNEAALAEIEFQAGKHAARGYALFLRAPDRDYALLAFAPRASYAAFFPELLSCLDSFASGRAERLRPGPLSQFYSPFPPREAKMREIAFRGTKIAFATGDEEPEANQLVIEREAKILAAGKGDFVEAWRRHYRAVYRDTYARLAPLADRAMEALESEGLRREAAPAALLSWLQGFAYTRTKTLSDLQSPLSCVLSGSGDCDSLGLAYVILLRRVGFDAVLLVSSKYGHAMAGVDIPGAGARISYEGKNYLVAELTDKVALGLIDRDMADPSGWIPVAFERPVR